MLPVNRKFIGRADLIVSKCRRSTVMTQIFPIRNGWDGYDKKILQQQLKASNKNSLSTYTYAGEWLRIATLNR